MSRAAPKRKECSADELAEILGISPRRIRQLAEDGTVKNLAHGRYDLVASVRGYIEFRERSAMAAGPEDYERERTLLTRAKREEAEVRTALLVGTAGDMGILREIMCDLILRARNKLLGIPATYAGQLASETDPNQIAALLNEGVTTALAELASAKPGDVVRRYLERHREDLGAAAETDAEPVG
jgi:phage terminase Nu1 subunit (DNA packaging protein)